jgi:hypothetical protein
MTGWMIPSGSNSSPQAEVSTTDDWVDDTFWE